jgi:hypothetical protein
MGFAFPVVDRKYGAGDAVLLRTRVNSVTNMSAEVVAFVCLDRSGDVCIPFFFFLFLLFYKYIYNL